MGANETLLQPQQELIIPTIVWESYEGRASWYGPGFHGEKMANGQIYDQNKILVAHRILPLGLKVRVTNLKNSKSIVAYVLDRGPYTKKNGKYDREIDLSYAAAKALHAIQPGVISVRITPLQG
ncbi:MAG: septal ring lytic transglycosylase RlpA family protein [Candidatus Pacebacteria bacterium]|nr:septal ring lytic transglycosylase RlpA family protein [Candidatus Paceibacterota bacterium]